MLPPENRNRHNPEAVKSGDGLATALFYLALGLLAAGGSLAVISRSLRYAAMRDSSQISSGSARFYRRELPAVEESRKSGRPLLVLIESQGMPVVDPLLQPRLQCCVLYLIQSQDEEFQLLPGRSEFRGALEGLPHYVLLSSEGQVLRAGASLAKVLDVLAERR